MPNSPVVCIADEITGTLIDRCRAPQVGQAGSYSDGVGNPANTIIEVKTAIAVLVSRTQRPSAPSVSSQVSRSFRGVFC